MGAGKLNKSAAKAELEKHWEGFDRLAGTHLSWYRTGTRKWDLATRSGEVLASADSSRFTVGGATYETRVEDHAKWLVDEAGTPVLHFEGRHFEGKADTKVRLRDQSMLSFPVIGRWNRAIMSAIDESGDTLVQYRLGPPTHGLPIKSYSLRRVDSVVTPSATEVPDISLIVATTPKLLFRYFATRIRIVG